VVDASNKIQTEARNTVAGYGEKRAAIEALHAAGELDPARLAAFACDKLFDEAAIALSIMSNLPTVLIERAIASERPEQILIVAKAIELPWETAREILQLKGRSAGRPALDLERCAETFARLQQATAKQALNFYRLRERAAASGSP